ncbi:class I SAM-dependent methyltransferase [Thalassococcus sp. BH17M4-6]|uniref:class I SAM-dependent methyltransferase n=1 Tax=Thalassococcus sp. BH17M4-6 TaxID=3413148 RepID=UPI003BE52C25
MTDAETLRVYDRMALDYDKISSAVGPDDTLQAFIAAMPPGGRVLDLGCGPGRSAMYMARAGLVVDATDASATMVAMAQKIPGVTAWQARFDDLDAEAAYDGVWANFCLLHATRAEVPRHLRAIRRAIKPGGVLHVGVKEGEGEARDSLGRRYTYFTVPEMDRLMREAGFVPGPATHGADAGLDGVVAAFFTLSGTADG